MTITKPNIASLYKGNLPWFVENTIFTTLHGSHAYGTNIETSDIDVKGIFVLPKKNYYSVLESPEQVQLKEPDAVIFELRKFLKLAADCNPNIIEVLFTDESDWCSITPAGRLLVENKEKFLSTKIKHTFFGYAKSQLGRINLHYRWLKNPPTQPPTRTEFGLRENPELSRDQFGVVESQVKKKMEEWDVNWDELDFSEKVNIQTRISKMLAECKIVTSNDLWMAAAKLLGFEDNFLVYLQKEKEYKQKCADWDSYQEWKVKRNPQRSELEARYGFDCYTEDTEFLTENGWLSYDQIKDNVRLATVDKQTGTLEFQNFYERVKKPYNGIIMEFETANTFCSVTPNHRMLVSPCQRTSQNKFSTSYEDKNAYWHIEKAQELVDGYKSYFHVRSTIRQEIDNVEITDELLAIVGAYVSEGSIGKRLKDKTPSVLRFSQKEGGRQQIFLDNIKSLNKKMRRYDIFRKDKNIVELVYTLADRELVKKIVDWCGDKSKNKKLPEWHLSLSTRQARFLLDVLVAGDGTQRKFSRVYYTISKKLADDIQSLALIAGYVTKIWGPYANRRNTLMYQVYIGNEKIADTIVTKKESGSVKKYEYSGNIVCFSVPNEIIVTRKCGKIAIQGNTKHGMHLIRLMRMCKEVLTTGKVNVKRQDAEELLSIRRGNLSYEELIEYSNKLEDEIEQLYLKCDVLPKRPNLDFVDDLAMRIAEMVHK